jgi:hypothetical protein
MVIVPRGVATVPPFVAITGVTLATGCDAALASWFPLLGRLL